MTTKKTMRFGTPQPTRFDTLLQSLPSIARAPGLRPWDSTRFLACLCSSGLSHGELLAARLALGVWNTGTDWVEEARKDGLPHPENARRFDVLEAAAVWDSAHREALRTWLEGSYFP